MEFWIFKKVFQKSKFIGLKISYTIEKFLKDKFLKINSHDSFEYLKHKLWAKERSGVKLPI
jgi:hypothetical protein